jgi:hypothetical protein
MTQRLLTTDELADMKSIHDLIGRRREILYEAASTSCVVEMSHATSNAYTHATTDGKPLRTERVPTAADIGKRVRVRENAGLPWSDRNYRFAGVLFDGTFIVENECAGLAFFRYATIDQEAAQ